LPPEHIPLSANLERLTGVLFDQSVIGMPVRADFDDTGKNSSHHDRRDTGGSSFQHQNFGLGHQRATTATC